MANAIEPKVTEPARIVKANHYLGLISTVVGICGGLGTLFVWLTANFYVGDIEVVTDRPVDSMAIRVYDRKGGETTFHTSKFQLMPGIYHFDVVPAGAITAHADAQVSFAKKTVIPVSVTSGADDSSGEDTHPVKKHWWQFWRG